MTFQIRRKDPKTLILLYKDGIDTLWGYRIIKYFTGTQKEAITEINRLRSKKEDICPIVYQE